MENETTMSLNVLPDGSIQGCLKTSEEEGSLEVNFSFGREPSLDIAKKVQRNYTISERDGKLFATQVCIMMETTNE